MHRGAEYFCPRCGTRRGDAGTCARDGTDLAAILETSLLGTEVGNYVLVQLLGEGGMGAVYRAVQPAIGSEVAIKVLHATTDAHPEAVKRFLLEAQAVNRVRHRNLIRILDTGYLADRRPYLVMELLDGMSMSDAVGSLSAELACHATCEALDALEAVHEEGIVHRDLKPANVFLARDGRVVVLDFGIAKLVDPDTRAATHSSGLVGTPEYMAPEQIRSQPLDRRTDVYAMGVLLYETITGRRPFAAAVTFDMLVQHLERPPAPPRDYRPELSPAINDAILRALAKAPEDRFATAGAMATALRATLGTADHRAALASFIAANAPAPPPTPLDRHTPPALDVPGSSPAIGEAATQVERPRPAAVPTVPGRGGAGPTLAESRRGAAPPTAETRRDVPVTTAPARPRGRLLALGGALLVATTAVIVLATRKGAAPDRVATASPVADAAAAMSPTPDASTASDAPDAAGTGTLELRSNPPGARLFVDHVDRGSSPVTLVLPPGAHHVRAELAGYAAVDDAAEVRAAERSTVVLSLGAPSPRRVDGTRPVSGAGRTTITTPLPTEPVESGGPPPPPVPVDAGTTGTTGRRVKDNPFPTP